MTNAPALTQLTNAKDRMPPRARGVLTPTHQVKRTTPPYLVDRPRARTKLARLKRNATVTANKPKAAPDTGNALPPPSPPPTTPVTPEVPMPPITPTLTQLGLPATYPQSEPEVTPPPINLPTHMSENSPSPPTSPTPPPRTTVNTPQPSFAIPQDVDMTPAPLHHSLPSTPTQNVLGIRLQPSETTPILKMSSIVARLEEVENDNLGRTGRLPARNALDKYTPGPMPPIQDIHPTAPFDNIDLKLVEEWDAHPGEKLIAVPFDTEARDTNSHDLIRAKILTAVAEITNAQEANVAALRLKLSTKPSNLPTSFLVYNITAEQAEFLLNRGVWSSRAITFRVTRFAPTCPTFLFALRGFITTTMKDVFPIVKQVWESEDTKVFVTQLTNAVPASERERVTLEIDHFLKSMNLVRLDIKEAGNTLNPHFNVHADSNQISHDEIWRRLRAFLINQKYASSMQGQATPQKIPYVCTCCHGADHPRGLCPFPSVAGWNGPTRETEGDFPRRRNGGFSGAAQRPQNPRFSSRP
ncbi:hypothetical protein EDB84DRAFT_1441687 [Lactarius hengduanensis]|nr:hypothetical protein EDB84DRAFT_1441687 [Lactarius hengduanensis]